MGTSEKPGRFCKASIQPQVNRFKTRKVCRQQKQQKRRILHKARKKKVLGQRHKLHKLSPDFLLRASGWLRGSTVKTLTSGLSAIQRHFPQCGELSFHKLLYDPETKHNHTRQARPLCFLTTEDPSSALAKARNKMAHVFFQILWLKWALYFDIRQLLSGLVR